MSCSLGFVELQFNLFRGQTFWTNVNHIRFVWPQGRREYFCFKKKTNRVNDTIQEYTNEKRLKFYDTFTQWRLLLDLNQRTLASCLFSRQVD